MKDTAWVIINPGGTIFWNTTSEKSTEAKGKFVNKRPISFHWKMMYKIGFRCKRVGLIGYHTKE